MSSIWNKAMYFLGLDEESRELDERQPAPMAQPAEVTGGAPRGRRVEPPSGRGWRPANTEARMESVTVPASATAVRQVPGRDAQAEIVVAHDFADAQLLADHLRVRRAVVLDLRDTEPDTVRRLVDFASGITYALEGTMQKVAQGVILVAPARTTLGDDEVQRLHELGLYELDA
ncbi:MAG: cell division protein SepF [Acidimicrobiia bacterium]|nr:cell division protein SepF [Acidimicrobiia bacterium]MBT8216573.1 cell division protein SepF [Acidimicrobiia bacterium]NNF11213.1 cell division protein SepF [Acidimicrobiia bacterium]NNL68949.1 cell division protein SepF [Acidimicrobiia bacterium]RZV40784.1 MAG: cell division protein SepF [Acidimicrobiia bacterium]